VLPISGPPIPRGLLGVRDGRIVGVGPEEDRAALLTEWAATPADVVDLGDRAILPGLVNAHTHLELSWMRGLLPPGDSMPGWAARLMALRAGSAGDPEEPIARAVAEARAAGTALVGDVTNTLAAYDTVARSGLGGIVFRELLGFRAVDPEELVSAALARLSALPPAPRLAATVVPHAPYSVSPAFFAAIGAATDAPLSVHLGESPEELQFLRDGTGAWRELLEGIGAWNDRWRAPGCGPVEYLDRLGLVNRRLLAVHGTQFREPEIARLAAAGATIVTCPRSNRWTGAGVPPIAQFYASGVRVAVGTDSLASVEDLNVFAELAAVRQLAPHVPARHLLESATICGAAALGLGAHHGTIDPGKRADLIAVRVPAGVDDVEEYLLQAIEPDALEWLE
jgi:aminodeoxyfutalosine deaminase